MRPFGNPPNHKKLVAQDRDSGATRNATLMAVFVPHFPALFKPEVAIHANGEGDVVPEPISPAD